MSYNAWLFVYANPINQVDPSGKYPTDGLDWEPYTDYNEKQHPSGINFDGTSLASPAIYKLNNKGERYRVTPGTNASQFIDNWMEPGWEHYWGEDDQGNSVEFASHTGLCGLASLAAILTRVSPNISLNDVVDTWDMLYDKVAPDYLELSSIKGFIKDAYSDFLQTRSGSFIETDAGFDTNVPKFLRQKLVGGSQLITGIQVDGSGGFLTRGLGVKNGAYGTKHWVVITGISNQWDREAEPDSRYKWIRIYNPFDNETEYYWWPDFKGSWRFENNNGSYLEVWPRRRTPFPIKDCCLPNRSCK